MPLRHRLATGYLKRGTTLAELADRTGIDRQGLEATIAEFNASAAEGRDPAFGKGSRAYNRSRAMRCMGPTPASRRSRTDRLCDQDGGRRSRHLCRHQDRRTARALNEHGQPIAGLYAAGNDMASIMGGNYPGAGITLGPALTFGYIAGKHIAGPASLVRSR